MLFQIVPTLKIMNQFEIFSEIQLIICQSVLKYVTGKKYGSHLIQIEQRFPNGGLRPGTGPRKQTGGSPKSFYLILNFIIINLNNLNRYRLLYTTNNQLAPMVSPLQLIITKSN